MNSQVVTAGESTIQFTRDDQNGTFVLHAEQWLPCPRAKLIEFFSDAFKLEALTPPLLRFQVLTPAPIVIQAGTRIDYKLRLHGIPIRWQCHWALQNQPLMGACRRPGYGC